MIWRLVICDEFKCSIDFCGFHVTTVYQQLMSSRNMHVIWRGSLQMKSDKSGNLLKEMRTHQQGCDYNKLGGGNCSQHFQLLILRSDFSRLCQLDREWSFSKPALAKTRLRSTMDQKRLNQLVLMSIESDIMCRLNLLPEKQERKSTKGKNMLCCYAMPFYLFTVFYQAICPILYP